MLSTATLWEPMRALGSNVLTVNVLQSKICAQPLPYEIDLSFPPRVSGTAFRLGVRSGRGLGSAHTAICIQSLRLERVTK
jgi:hypothetical protein